MQLTEKAVQALKFDGKRRVVWDDGDLRFGVSIGKASRVYVVDYTFDGRRRRMHLGKTSEIKLEIARGLAGDALAEVRKGRDPLGDRRERAQAVREEAVQAKTLSDLWERYLAEYVAHPSPRDRKGRKPLAPRTATDYRWFWERCIKPKLGNRRLKTLNRLMVEAWHDSFEESPYNGNRALTLLSGMLTFAEKRGLIASNPARGVAQFKEQSRERFLSSDEVEALAKVLTAAENPPKAAKGKEQVKAEPWQAIAAVRLLLLTGARKSEVLSMQWADLDLERGIWNMPTSKTGAREVRLSPAAVDLLQGLDRLEGNPFVLPGRRHGGRFVGLQKVWERVREASGLEGVRIHDLRHSYASEALGAGLSLRVVQQLLGHAELRTTERYAHLERDAIREAADKVGAALSAKLDGKKPAAVVDHKRQHGDGP